MNRKPWRLLGQLILSILLFLGAVVVLIWKAPFVVLGAVLLRLADVTLKWSPPVP